MFGKENHKKIINRCIYCGNTGPQLTDEHIIPYALNGDFILKNASCSECQKITSTFESNVLKYIWGDFRNGAGFRSRNKKKNNKIEISIINKKGEEDKLILPKDEQMIYIILPEYEEPGYLIGKDNKGVNVVGTTTFIHTPKMPIENFREKYELSGFKISSTYSYSDFPRLLMKIAYGMAIFQYGYDCFEENYVLPYILDKHKDGLGNFVGTAKNKIILPQAGIVTILLGFVNNSSDLMANIKFFPSIKNGEETMPEYLVVLGHLKEQFIPKNK
ncbi:MAG: HNH endonuclease [Methanofollis sp.]|uniref:HNH endonuclease n=1 Tax=Methanofollis sp. TaxID=2052835 RepID=UPI00262271C3|nr:HNH endonuclease [Methanofollis sp.]MDD4255704.1 HNH endonuclease [Methanofollis sp.]